MARIDFNDARVPPRLAASTASTFFRHRIETVNKLRHGKGLRSVL